MLQLETVGQGILFTTVEHMDEGGNRWLNLPCLQTLRTPVVHECFD